MHELRGGLVPDIGRRDGVRTLPGRQLQRRRSASMHLMQRGHVPAEPRHVLVRGLSGGELLRFDGAGVGVGVVLGRDLFGGLSDGVLGLPGGFGIRGGFGDVLKLRPRLLPVVHGSDDLRGLRGGDPASEPWAHGVRRVPGGELLRVIRPRSGYRVMLDRPVLGGVGHCVRQLRGRETASVGGVVVVRFMPCG